MEKIDDIKILVVDDNEDNRFIAMRNLKRGLGFTNATEADDGRAAMDYLAKFPDVDIVFLDRMMPDVTGIDFCKELKEKNIPFHGIIIFQTGKVAPDELQEILDVNVIHLMRKPYTEEDMAAFFFPLAEEARRKKEFYAKLSNLKQPTPLTEEKKFTLRTPEEARKLAIEIAAHFPRPVDTALAIYELLENAIEHGHLKLTDKEGLWRKREFKQEIARRLASPENDKKQVEISVIPSSAGITINIRDQGDGFEPTRYISMSAERLLRPHGKGISKASRLFDKLTYSTKGNEVTAVMLHSSPPRHLFA